MKLSEWACRLFAEFANEWADTPTGFRRVHPILWNRSFSQQTPGILLVVGNKDTITFNSLRLTAANLELIDVAITDAATFKDPPQINLPQGYSVERFTVAGKVKESSLGLSNTQLSEQQQQEQQKRALSNCTVSQITDCPAATTNEELR